MFKRLLVRGLGQPEAEAEFEGHCRDPVTSRNAATPLVLSEKLKWTEQISDGTENVDAVIVALQTGTRIAKVVVKIADS